MNLLKRFIEITEAKFNSLLNRVEDPNELLDLSYEKMLTGLQEVKQHLADVVTEQKRLENKIMNCDKNIAEREEEARSALKLNKEDLAKKALELKQTEIQHKSELENGYQQVSLQAEKLKNMEQKYRSRIEQFSQQKEITKATYQAAQAQVKIKEYCVNTVCEKKKLGKVITALRKAHPYETLPLQVIKLVNIK